MVSPSQLASWQPARLAEIAESVVGHRRALTALDDDLESGRPPASWTFTDATAARAEHHRLSGLLATQVSETTGVIEALDTAVTAITSAKHLLEGAMRRAGAHGLHVDHGTGAVSLARTFDDDERAYARTVQNEVAEQIETALADADAADRALAAALTSAAATDVNSVGSLTDQRLLVDLLATSPAEQARYLLDHPEQFALLGPHVSDEVKAQVGSALADDLDRLARHPEAFGDAATVARYASLLDAFGDDPAVMAPMYTRLGPDGLLGTYNGLAGMLYVSAGDENLARRADELRAGLQTATRSPGFDGEGFGQDLVRYATRTAGDALLDAYFRDYPSSPMDAAVLDHLLRDGEYGEDFVRGVAWQLDDFERTADPVLVQSWMHHTGDASPLNGLDVDPGSLLGRSPDPMAAAMGQLGKHPGLGLEFFTEEPERTEFYFAERDWSRDGFAGISEAALGIGTDPANIADAGHDTGMFVLEFFDKITKNPEFTAEHAGAASEPVGDLLKHYMPAVQFAVDNGVMTDDNGVGLRDLHDPPYLPIRGDYPVMDQMDLDRLLKVALSSDEGVARVAEGIAGFRQATLSGFAQVYPSVDSVEAQTTLYEQLGKSASLEGYVQKAVGEIAIDGARSKDQQVAAFTSLVSEAAGMLPVPFAGEVGEIAGQAGTKLWDAAWSHVSEIPTDRISATFAGNEDAQILTQTGEAQQGQRDMVINSYLSMVQAGIVDVPADKIDIWAPDGELVSLATIAPERMMEYRDEVNIAMRGVVDSSYLEGIYASEFTRWFTK